MNILFFTYWYPTLKKPNSGIFIREHAKAVSFDANGVFVLHVNYEKTKTLFKIKNEYIIEKSGVIVYRINIYSLFVNFLKTLHSLNYAIVRFILRKKIFPSFSPDIIHSHVVYPAGIIGNRVSKDLYIPHIITEHWSGITKMLSTPYRKIFPMKAYKDANYICPVSNFLANQLKNNAPVSDKQIKVIPNVIDNSLFTYRKKVKKSNKIRFLAIARWIKRKNSAKRPDLIIKSLAALNDQINQDVELEIIGGGSLIPELKELTNQYKLNVEFSGWLPKEKLVEAYNNADFLIHGSNIETFSVVIVEALKTGTPVIASNVGAIPELVNSENGRLCDNNLEDWVYNLKKLINTDFDNKKIADSFKDKFTYKDIGGKLSDLYLETLRQK